MEIVDPVLFCPYHCILKQVWLQSVMCPLLIIGPKRAGVDIETMSYLDFICVKKLLKANGMLGLIDVKYIGCWFCQVNN